RREPTRKRREPTPKDSSFKEIIMYGDLSTAPLDQLSAMVDELLIPLLQNPINNEAWPKFFFFFCYIYVFLSKTLLPVPMGADKVTEESLGNGHSVDTTLLHAIESVVIEWSHQIQNVPKKDSSQALLEDQNPLPKNETDFWKAKYVNLLNIHEQLSEPRVKKMAELLKKTNSSYYPASDSLLQDVSDALEEAKEIGLYLNRRQAISDLEKIQKEHEPLNKLYADSVAKSNNIKKQIESLEKLKQLKLEDQQKKLIIKYDRGPLLYGKSELPKRVAVYAGITMITQPLTAGELNRPYVGETERLLVDIMSRVKDIPYLICAMTIDEIDGLVPKRDNNAQQGKIDGISVLLSHIEGVKDIPNLIVFGATNRRNMMDEAFLRRMQAKVFVGRPSPAIRNNMFVTPLVCKDSCWCSSQCIELADSVVREFNVWFGISTLPEICRLNPSILNSTSHEENYSLDFDNLKPTGRILIDYSEKKCLIEMQNEPTLEKDLEKNETSLSFLLARFIYGCSTRNIDRIQTIDLNFLIKQNAFDENQIFELLTTTFLECNEYNRSMLILY
ncbi:unnamed protein product, partial [Didymodactylos carnosus]